MTLSSRLLRLVIGLPFALAMLANETQAQEIVISPHFDYAGNFHSSVAPVLVGKLWGLIDHNGAWVMEPRYADMGIGGAGLFAVKTENTWGYVDAKGRLAITSKFEQAEAFENGVAAVKMHGQWGYVRTDGTMETDFTFLEIGGREGAYVCARDAKGWAVFKILPKGPPIRQELDDNIQRAYSVSDGSIIAKYQDGDRLLLINSSGAPDNFYPSQQFPAYDDPSRFVSIRRMSEGFAPASTASNMWGYLHKASGEFLWPGRFQDALQFFQGFAPVKIDGKWGYIDRLGRVIVQPAYGAAFPFRGNYAVIRQDDKRGFLRLDPQGGISVFIAPRFDDAFRFTEGLAPVMIGGRWGYVSDGRPWRELVDTGIVKIRPR